jgi:hypothetical protein
VPRVVARVVGRLSQVRPPQPRWRRRTRRSIVLGVLVLAQLAAVMGVAPRILSAGNPASSIPLGDYAGFADPNGIGQFASTTHTKPALATDYLDHVDGWAEMESAAGLGAWRGYRLVLGVPMVPGSSGATLAQGATGGYDPYYYTLGLNLVAEGEADAVLRLGWEFNGNWYPWSVASAADAANFVAYWRQIVTTMRGVPGEAFTFLWNPNSGSATSYSADAAYPGDTYVDYVGTDLYDECWCTPQTPQNAWTNQLDEQWGLNWLAGFAATHTKAIAIPEWSVTIRSDGHGLGDDPYFVNQFASWISAHDVAFTDIFSYNDTAGGQDNDITDGNFPNALAAFQADFGVTAVSPTTTPPTTSPTTVPPTTTTSVSRSPASTTPPTPATAPHVMVVMMENKDYNEVIGQTSTEPFTNSLATGYGLATDSNAMTHPSLPNYLAIASGSTQGVSVDEAPSASGVFGGPTLASQLSGAGLSAKAYAEDLPSDPTNDSGEYAVRHNPWEYFINTMPVADASTLTADLNGQSPPDFVWYTPNLIDDEHDGTVQQGDAFLSSFIPSVQATSWYKAGGRIIVEWDEAEDADTSGINGGDGGHVPTIVVSAALGASPQQSSSAVDTVGVLHSIEDVYGVGHLGGSNADGDIDALLTAGSGPAPTTTTTAPTTTTTAPTTTTTAPTTTTTAPRPPSTTTTAPSTTTTSVPRPTTTTTPPTTTSTIPITTTTTAPTPFAPVPPAPGSVPTAIVLSMQRDPSTGAADLSAQVTPVPDGGTMQFDIDDSPNATVVPVSASGVATASFAFPDGTHSVIATYSGSNGFMSCMTYATVTIHHDSPPSGDSDGDGGSGSWDGTISTGLAPMQSITSATELADLAGRHPTGGDARLAGALALLGFGCIDCALLLSWRRRRLAAASLRHGARRSL